MTNYTYSIDLVMKDDCDIEVASSEFTRALELPKKLFQQNLQFMTLRYSADEKNMAYEHCAKLNHEISLYGYKNVEFRIRES